MVISRGSELQRDREGPAPRRPGAAETGAAGAPLSARSQAAGPRLALVSDARGDLPGVDPQLVAYRIAALDKLSQLLDRGLLTPDEFETEKALVLRIPAEELLLKPAASPPRPGPSLIGRLMNWKLLALGLAAGLAFSWASEPRDLATLVERASTFLG